VIRYTLTTPAPGPAVVLAPCDGPEPVHDALPVEVALTLCARWAGAARVEAAWIGWVVVVRDAIVAAIDYGPAPVEEDPRQARLFGGGP
ncbi:MAG: hypothetical protein ACO3JT_09230, partial [Candidatus Nanopelagicales bacterium]